MYVSLLILVALNNLQRLDVTQRPTSTQPHQSPQQRKPPHPAHPTCSLVVTGVPQVPCGPWARQEPTVS